MVRVTVLTILLGATTFGCLGGSPACPDGQRACTCQGQGGALNYYCAASCAPVPSCSIDEGDGGS